MRLIANKPCSFGGRQFYIDDEIPEEFVVDARAQEKMGVITIVKDGVGEPDGQSVPLYTQEQVEEMLAEAIAEAVDNTVQDMRKEQEALQAAGGRGTAKNAAKKRVDKSFPAGGNPNESIGGNATTGTNTEGAGT